MSHHSKNSSINQKCFRILFCHNEPFGTFVKSAKFQSNHFAPLLPTIQKRKKSNSNHNSSASKKICLKLPEMESLASRFNKGKQSKLKFKPCLKPLFVSAMVSQSTSSTIFLNSDCVRLNTSTLPTSSSSIVTSVSLRSFNCSSGNTASNVDCTIRNDADSFSGKGKYKNDVITFFSLRFPNDLSNGEKEKLIKNVFVRKSNFVFPIAKRYFCYYWLDLYPWLTYSPVRDGAFCLFCVLFCNKVVTRKKKLVYLPYSDWSDPQAQFKRNVNAINGIHSESMKNCSSFLNEMAGKVVPVNVQVVQASEQTKKNNRILLSIIDLLKTAGQMGIPLRGHRYDSQYHPEVGEPATHAGVDNFVELLNFAVRQGNKDLEDHLKNCSNRETYISKTTQNNLLNCCYDLMTEAIINKVKQAKSFSVLCDEDSDSSNKEQLSFCLRYVDENGDICEDFLKYIHCQSGLTGKDLYNEIISSLESFNLDIQNCCG